MIFLQIAAFEAHKQRRSMTVKENVHIRLNVHGSAFECAGKYSINFLTMNFDIAAGSFRDNDVTIQTIEKSSTSDYCE